VARPTAPSYRGEGPHALWHASEDATIERFEPHVAPTSVERERLVWAIDTRHLPAYCPSSSGRRNGVGLTHGIVVRLSAVLDPVVDADVAPAIAEAA
jgi:hypothetical protein